MRLLVLALALSPLTADAALPAPGTPGAPADARYCGEPARYANGVIKRSWAERERFVSAWPRPTLPGVWYVDHVLPLRQGGCDLPFNMQWLNDATKTCPEVCKDRWEQDVYKTKDTAP